MEFVQYFRLIKKWLWLLIIVALIGGMLGYTAGIARPVSYTASTMLAIGQYIQSANPTTSQINISENLSETYQNLVTTRSILQAVVNSLDLKDADPDDLKGSISTDTIPGTSLLVITVTTLDPVLSQDLANALADALVNQSLSNLPLDEQSQLDLANTQIKSLTQLISEQQIYLQKLDQQIASETNSNQLQALGVLRNQTVNQITGANSSIVQFQAIIINLQSLTNTVRVIETADEASGAGSGSGVTSGLAGAVAGVALALGVALIFEYIDDKIRTTSEASRILGLPVYGAIPKFGARNDSYTQKLIVDPRTFSPVTEAYRKLRANLMLSPHERKIFLITSSGPSEGKSLTTANLATILAASGFRILLIDADLRRPRLHEIFELDNEVGLTTLLNHDLKFEPDDNGGSLALMLNQTLQTTQIPNLRVITSGFVPANPTELLGSSLMKRWLQALQQLTNVDIIVIDTPPTTMFSDVSSLATISNVNVLMVIDTLRTRRFAAIQAIEQLRQVKANINGLILNKINLQDENGYYNEYDYYTSDVEPRRRWLPRAVRRIQPQNPRHEKG